MQWIGDQFEFALDDESKILIPNSVLSIWHQYRQTGLVDCEAGGMILGCLRESHFEVRLVTEPMLGDKRSRYRFDREDHTHLKIAECAWNDASGLVGHIGEWHTHPEVGMVSPSLIDRRAWHKLTQTNKATTLFVIVGIDAIYFSSSKKTQHLYWDQVHFFNSTGSFLIEYESM
jgi:integrative and conjugative element protein (TIGR02256 family)